MNTTKQQSTHPVLTGMGFKVCAVKYGVYQLKRFNGPAGELTFDGVGIFVSLKPVADTDVVYFFEFNAISFKDDLPAFNRLLANWGDLDARRLEESGITGVPVSAVELFGAVVHDDLPIERPTAGRWRSTALMASGEVICYA